MMLMRDKQAQVHRIEAARGQGGWRRLSGWMEPAEGRGAAGLACGFGRQLFPLGWVRRGSGRLMSSQWGQGQIETAQ